MLLPGMELWLDAFWRLSTERQIGMTVGPIPDSKISEFIRENGIKDRRLFRHCIRSADAFYLDHISKGDKADRIMSEPFGPGMLRGKT